MTQVTVKELANVVDTPVERLLQQMREAGLPHTSAEQVVTDNEKQTLLNHLKGDGKGEGPRKITLQRKTTQTLKVSGSKTISVEVRKKKTYVKRSPAEIEAEKQREQEAQRQAEEAARQKAEEARRQAEAEAARLEAEKKSAAPEVAAVDSVAKAPAAPSEERKKEEPRRPERTRDDDERRDRKEAQRPSLKSKGPAPRIAPRNADDEGEGFRRGGRGGKGRLKKRNQHGFHSPSGPIVRDVAIGETITVSELAQQMAVKAAEVIKFMFKM